MDKSKNNKVISNICGMIFIVFSLILLIIDIGMLIGFIIGVDFILFLHYIANEYGKNNKRN